MIAADEHVAVSASGRVDRKIENLGILDQAGFATIRLELYQPERLDELIIPDSQRLMKASFGDSVRAALYNGLEALKFIIVALCNIWALLLTGAFIWLVIRYRKRIFGSVKPAAAGK